MSKHDTAKKGAHRHAPEEEAGKAKAERKETGETATAESAPAAEASADSPEAAATVESGASGTSLFEEEVKALKDLATKKEAEAKEHYDRLTYLAAEFDNYRRRTQKEKEKLFSEAVVEVSGAFLPVMDNLERAIKAAEAAEAAEAVTLRDGVAMVARQLGEVLAKMGIQEIAALGATFDPNLHNAVMHIEDDAFGAGEVVDVFQKGYRYKEDAIVRHAMVKVAN